MQAAKHILLVEDDIDDQKFFFSAVSRLIPSVQCDIAANGEEAFKMVSIYPSYDVIFMDLNMPVMDGSTCLAKLKLSQYKNIPVVILTTSKNERDKERCKNLGASFYWIKPDSADTLFNGLKSILTKEVKFW
jgi:CheY-like chemotaxis protein